MAKKRLGGGGESSYDTRDPRIRVVYSSEAGQVPAINYFTRWAEQEGISRVVITDADIYRRPDCLVKLRETMLEDGSIDLVGANHFVYPLSWIESKIDLTSEEKFWYQVFEGDKDPKILPILEEFGFSRIIVNRNRVKGSLILVDTKVAVGMHGEQKKVSDSVINNSVFPERRRIADTCFYHMGRTSLRDHVLARLRHFQGAKAEGFDLSMYRREILSESTEQLNEIADLIRSQVNNEVAEYFLLRCALRNLTARYCFSFVNGEKLFFDDDGFFGNIDNYKSARCLIGLRLNRLQFDKTNPVINGVGTTQTELPRYAIDCESFIKLN